MSKGENITELKYPQKLCSVLGVLFILTFLEVEFMFSLFIICISRISSFVSKFTVQKLWSKFISSLSYLALNDLVVDIKFIASKMLVFPLPLFPTIILICGSKKTYLFM